MPTGCSIRLQMVSWAIGVYVLIRLPSTSLSRLAGLVYRTRKMSNMIASFRILIVTDETLANLSISDCVRIAIMSRANIHRTLSVCLCLMIQFFGLFMVDDATYGARSRTCSNGAMVKSIDFSRLLSHFELLKLASVHPGSNSDIRCRDAIRGILMRSSTCG